jgi:cyclopropane fatty-acyl-phospholipid synthase-like methyltransferase
MNNIFQKVLSRFLGVALNNTVTNQLLVLLSLDHLPKKILNRNDWTKWQYHEDKTFQENVGFSHIPAIQKLVDEAHAKLVEFCRQHLQAGNAVLDIGCGTGLYLQSISKNGYELYGVDMNKRFLEKTAEHLPYAQLAQAHYLDDFIAPVKFNLICSFSMLEYVEPSNLKNFFRKISDDLKPSGYVFILYPHALSFYDLLYPDITYVNHSPRRLGKAVSEKFNVIAHHHFYDGRKINWYDSQHYFFPDGTNKRLDTIENNSLLILQKK